MDSSREGKREGGGWKDGGRRIVQQKLPMLASQCGYVMRARDTDTHTHTHSQTHTHTLADTHLGLSLAPRLISGTQRPQTEVAEDTQWEQGLKAWFTSALREEVGGVSRERQCETATERESGRGGLPLRWTSTRKRGRGRGDRQGSAGLER